MQPTEQDPRFFVDPARTSVDLETDNPHLIVPYDFGTDGWIHEVNMWLRPGERETVQLQKLMNAWGIFDSPILILQAALVKLFRPQHFITWLEKKNRRQLAYMTLEKPRVGLWYGLFLHPASRPGNTFINLQKRQRSGGGATTGVIAQNPIGGWVVALLDQDRPLQEQRHSILQIPASYAVDAPGDAEQVQAATAGITTRLVGKMKTIASPVLAILARYNPDNGENVTVKGDGIGVQVVEIPWNFLEADDENGTSYHLTEARADMSDPLLRGVRSTTFYPLNRALLLKANQPSEANDETRCGKTCMALFSLALYLNVDIRS